MIYEQAGDLKVVKTKVYKSNPSKINLYAPNICWLSLFLLIMIKPYYLPASRAITTGIILLLIGLSPLYGTMLIEHSVSAGFQFVIETFTGFPEIILGVMCLVIILSGALYLINARKILRLKLDEKGIYYMPFAEGNPSKFRPLFNLFFLKKTLKFIPYNHMASAGYVNSKWWGGFVRIDLKNGESRRLLTAPFTVADKEELATIINNSLTYSKAQ
jgi:hypothetical protein